MVQVIGRMYMPQIGGRKQVVYETKFELTENNWRNFHKEVMFARTQERDITYEVVLSESQIVDVMFATIGIERSEIANKARRIISVERYYSLYIRQYVNEFGDLDIIEDDEL